MSNINKVINKAFYFNICLCLFIIFKANFRNESHWKKNTHICISSYLHNTLIQIDQAGLI